MAEAAHETRGLGLHRGQVCDGPGVVVLSVLDSRVPADHLPAAPDEPWAAAGGHLRGGGCGLDFGRLALGRDDLARMGLECRAKDRYAALRLRGDTCDFAGGCARAVGNGRADRDSCGGASGVVGESVYIGLGYISATYSW